MLSETRIKLSFLNVSFQNGRDLPIPEDEHQLMYCIPIEFSESEFQSHVSRGEQEQGGWLACMSFICGKGPLHRLIYCALCDLHLGGTITCN